MDMSYGDAVELTEAEKRVHTLKVLCEWPSAREQLKLENRYDPKLGIHFGDKLWTNQQVSALKVYKSIDAKSGDILEKILEREGTLDVFSTETSSLFPIFSSNSLDEIQKELQRSVFTLYILHFTLFAASHKIFASRLLQKNTCCSPMNIL